MNDLIQVQAMVDRTMINAVQLRVTDPASMPGMFSIQQAVIGDRVLLVIGLTVAPDGTPPESVPCLPGTRQHRILRQVNDLIAEYVGSPAHPGGPG